MTHKILLSIVKPKVGVQGLKMTAIVDYLGMWQVRLAALTLSTVIIWKVLNNIIDNDNANDDEQVEAGMSDAADVMRDLLRKGLQVNSAIRIMLDKKSRDLLSEQQNGQ